ncbi:hypothetical protein G3I13_20725 [Streptomyces sp. SID6673]|nr:hypothetical protein [Streptomyces sp. SID11726]NEB26764.1 hypothetical protein [Streptomyces sp. SID6673]
MAEAGSDSAHPRDARPRDARPLDADERAELERLRAEVAGRTGRRGEGPSIWRRIGATVLVILCALLALTSVTTRYVRGELLDTEHYLTTVTPLASDPAVQAQVSAAVTEQIDSRVDIQQMTQQALQQIVDLTPADRPRVDQALVGLAPVLASQAESFVHKTVDDFVRSSTFKDLWVAANRAAHRSVVAAVTGETQRDAVKIGSDGTISIQLGPIIEQVKQRLQDRGFAFAGSIPQVDKQFVVFQSPDLAKAQRWVRALDKIASILPWLAILAAVGAVALIGSGRRLRMLAIVGIAITLSMLVLAIGLLVGRSIYLGQVPPDVLAPDAARVIFDTVVAPLRLALRAVAVVGLVVAVAAFLAGGSRAALAVRHGFTRGVGAVDSRRAARAPNTFERVLWQARIAVRIGVVAIAALVLMFWPYPTGLVVIWTVVIACVVLAALEVAMQPARRAPIPVVEGPADEGPAEPVTADDETTGPTDPPVSARGDQA